MEKQGMTEKLEKSKAWSYGLPILLFVLIVVGVCICFRAKKSLHPEAVFFGDSIIATARGGDSVPDRLADLVGIPFLNAAYGGTAMAKLDLSENMDDRWDFLSMTSLTKSIASNDFSPQQRVSDMGIATEYFAELTDELDRVDFQRVRLMMLCFGMNDYQSGVPLKNSESPMDVHSFEGALRMTLTELKKALPDCRILLVSPTYSWYVTDGQTCEERRFGDALLEDYVELERSIAAQCGVEMIDLYHGLYTHDVFEDWKTYTLDGVHPNETGRKLITERIAAYLEEHP